MLPLGDGRYLARDGEEDEEGRRVLVIATTGAPPPAKRRRRRPRRAEADAGPEPLPLTRATAVRAFEPFESAEEAARWLDEATEAEDTIDVLVEEGIALLNRALHAQRAAAADPYAHELVAERAAVVRIGYGSGDEVADSRFADAREVDVRGGPRARRRRGDDLRPQERVAALLGGREQLASCETLLLRARVDLDADRWREAALQLRVALEALLVELREALSDPSHEEDMAVLAERRGEAGDAANAALRGELDAESRQRVRELIQLSERVLRRRRVLRG